MLYEPEYGGGRHGGRDPRALPALRSIAPPAALYGTRQAAPPGPMYGQVQRYGGPPRPGPPRGPPEFIVSYLGSVPLEQSSFQGSEPNVEDVSGVVGYALNRRDSLVREGTRMKTYLLKLGAETITFNMTETRDVQQIPVNKIHFVAADPRDPSVFSLVARGRDGRFLCHVFECSSYRQCDVITKAVSEAFRIGYEKWLRVEENQRRLEERRSREMDMGGLEYFQEWDDHAPRGMPLYNISSYYNSGASRPRQYLGPRDEMPRLPERLPERLVVSSRSNQGGEQEPYSMRYNFDDDEYDEYDDSPQEEVYVRQQAGGRRGNSGGNSGGNGRRDRDRDRGRQPQLVFDVSPEWE